MRDLLLILSIAALLGCRSNAEQPPTRATALAAAQDDEVMTCSLPNETIDLTPRECANRALAQLRAEHRRADEAADNFDRCDRDRQRTIQAAAQDVEVAAAQPEQPDELTTTCLAQENTLLKPSDSPETLKERLPIARAHYETCHEAIRLFLETAKTTPSQAEFVEPARSLMHALYINYFGTLIDIISLEEFPKGPDYFTFNEERAIATMRKHLVAEFDRERDQTQTSYQLNDIRAAFDADKLQRARDLGEQEVVDYIQHAAPDDSFVAQLRKETTSPEP